jgi:hypothetical protein
LAGDSGAVQSHPKKPLAIHFVRARDGSTLVTVEHGRMNGPFPLSDATVTIHNVDTRCRAQVVEGGDVIESIWRREVILGVIRYYVHTKNRIYRDTHIGRSALCLNRQAYNAPRNPSPHPRCTQCLHPPQHPHSPHHFPPSPSPPPTTGTSTSATARCSASRSRTRPPSSVAPS